MILYSEVEDVVANYTVNDFELTQNNYLTQVAVKLMFLKSHSQK